MGKLQQYMNGAIRRIMVKAYASALVNPRQAAVALRLQKTFLRCEKVRSEVSAREGIDIPPFLISSISTTCNLHCKGCYARSNGIASDTEGKPSMTPSQWHDIFSEAASLGINFSLLAGGEPLMRKDILEEVAKVEDMIFPIFTNGTLIGKGYLDFFRRNLNMIPVISIEGTRLGTDERRGQGVFQRALRSMEALNSEGLFFGASITVTTGNMELVTSDDFVNKLHELGCKIIFYVEYVPTEPGTEHLALSEGDNIRMAQLLDIQWNKHDDIIFLSFPGDEKEMGGCLAGGRGFFHIGPDGSAEPCPFSPFSDSSVLGEGGVLGALKSPLFRRLREAGLIGGEHTGGCALWEHRNEVAALLSV